MPLDCPIECKGLEGGYKGRLGAAFLPAEAASQGSSRLEEEAMGQCETTALLDSGTGLAVRGE